MSWQTRWYVLLDDKPYVLHMTLQLSHTDAGQAERGCDNDPTLSHEKCLRIVRETHIEREARAHART